MGGKGDAIFQEMENPGLRVFEKVFVVHCFFVPC